MTTTDPNRKETLTLIDRNMGKIGEVKKLKHKTMMGLLVRNAKNLPKEKKNAEVRAMIETYNRVVDFVDFDKLSSITDALK